MLKVFECLWSAFGRLRINIPHNIAEIDFLCNNLLFYLMIYMIIESIKSYRIKCSEGGTLYTNSKQTKKTTIISIHSFRSGRIVIYILMNAMPSIVLADRKTLIAGDEPNLRDVWINRKYFYLTPTDTSFNTDGQVSLYKLQKEMVARRTIRSRWCQKTDRRRSKGEREREE